MPESITKSSESKDQIWGAVRNGKVIKKGSSPEEVHDKMNDAGYDRGDYGITILPDPKRSRML